MTAEAIGPRTAPRASSTLQPRPIHWRSFLGGMATMFFIALAALGLYQVVSSVSKPGLDEWYADMMTREQIALQDFSEGLWLVALTTPTLGACEKVNRFWQAAIRGKNDWTLLDQAKIESLADQFRRYCEMQGKGSLKW